jgi:hypothetical protein
MIVNLEPTIAKGRKRACRAPELADQEPRLELI